MCMWRQNTVRATDSSGAGARRLMCAPSGRASRPSRPPERDGEEGDRDAEAERQRLAVPAGDEQAAHALDQVADRVDRGRGLEPVLLDQVARQRRPS